MSDIQEFIYIDRKRLRSYYEQAAPGKLVKPQKASKWNFNISVTGPKAGGGEAVHFRDRTNKEMIDEVEKYMRKSGTLISSLAEVPHPIMAAMEARLDPERTYYIRCKLQARRALIPPDSLHAATPGLDHLALWITEEEFTRSTERSVYLIEASSDADSRGIFLYTGYTALDFILRSLEKQMAAYRHTLLGRSELPNVHDYQANEPFHRFAANPITYLKEMGCTLGPPKKIESLSRIRMIFQDYMRESDSVGIVGYPLFIADSGTTTLTIGE
jgi:hypothetical protein